MSNEKPIYPQQRNLDGVYYRMERDGKFVNVCFTDLTIDERDEILKKYDTEQLKRLCSFLADRIRLIGDQFDIISE